MGNNLDKEVKKRLPQLNFMIAWAILFPMVSISLFFPCVPFYGAIGFAFLTGFPLEFVVKRMLEPEDDEEDDYGEGF